MRLGFGGNFSYVSLKLSSFSLSDLIRPTISLIRQREGHAARPNPIYILANAHMTQLFPGGHLMRRISSLWNQITQKSQNIRASQIPVQISGATPTHHVHYERSSGGRTLCFIHL